jgi:hypothetical protein
MNDWTGVIGDGLTLASVLVAALAAKFAADSAKAARETVPAIEALAGSMAKSVQAASSTVAELSTLVGQARLAIVEVQTAREVGELVRRLGHYERVSSAIHKVIEGHRRRFIDNMPDAYLRGGIAQLRAALTPLTRDDLPKARELADQMPSQVVNFMTEADVQVSEAVRLVHLKMAALTVRA